MKPRLLVSFSGGKTSAFMAKRLKIHYSHIWDMVFAFANTGCEWEETLLFADRCDREWGLDLIWLESVVHPREKKACTHKIVNFETASRNGEPFEEVIKKYGIPNQAYKHCTRELKLNPIRSYLESIGWDNAWRAVGIRLDEPTRWQKTAADTAICYPLVWLFPTTKPEINDWWEDQPFNLELQEHQGNCKWCWKKHLPKLIRIAKETPEAFGFPARMEAKYGLAGHNEDGTKRVFFRQHRSTQDIIGLSQILDLPPTIADPDEDSGCSESCEVFQ